MAADNLTAPLGLMKARSRWYSRIPYGLIGIGLIGTLFVSMLIWVTIVDDPMGGEPNLVIALGGSDEAIHHGKIAVIDPHADGKTGTPAAAGAGPDSSSGADARKTVAPPATASGGTTGEEETPAQPGSPLSVNPVDAAVEKGPHGPLPMTTADGRRPLDLYAAPIRPEAMHLPKVVLVVGGLGLSQRSTLSAIEKLPPSVTFAFAPYGSSLDRWMRASRKSGHEVMLQVPLEPYDYPDNDPGPQTLVTSLPVAANRDRLFWTLSRLTNYTGVVNYMGARFTASDEALRPVFDEVRKRGLFYLDDGSSSRSIASRLAAVTGTPFLRADLVVDANPDAADIDARLLQLESMARSRGVAVGFASALPVSIERIAEWARSLDSRGVYLVPASAAARGNK